MGDVAGCDAPGGAGERPYVKRSKSKLQRQASLVEKQFVAELFSNPDIARRQVLERCDVLADACTVLNRWAQIEGAYGTSLDKIIVSANKLNSLKGASGMVSAIAAVVGSFQSLGKHHLGLQHSILAQVGSVLQPMSKEHQRQVADLTADQLALQKEAIALRAQLVRAKEKAAESGRPDDTVAVQQASRKYEEQTLLQTNGLRHYLANLVSLWVHRDEVLLDSLDGIVEANRHVTSFNEEVVVALQSIVASIDVDAELRTEVASIVAIPNSGQQAVDSTAQGPVGRKRDESAQVDSAEREEENKDKEKDDPPARTASSTLDGPSLAGIVYEQLGTVDPDVASESVDAAAVVCSNSITLAEVAESVTKDLCQAIEERAKQVETLSTGLQLEALRVSGGFDDVLSEEQVRETERQAWRMFMVTMRQSSMVLADLGAKLAKCASKFVALKAAHERAKGQILAARSAAHKELQLVATALKEVRARLDAAEDGVAKSRTAADRARSDLAELRNKKEKADLVAADRRERASTSVSSASSLSSAADANGGAEDTSDAGVASPVGNAPGTSPSPIPRENASQEAEAARRSLDSADGLLRNSAALVTPERERAASERGSGNVVQRLFGLTGQKLGDQVIEATEKAARLDVSVEVAAEQRDQIKHELKLASERLEAQIKAYAVQIAGTVSGYVSAHASRVKELRTTLETMVSCVVEFLSTVRQLQTKLMSELSKIDAIADISLFLRAANSSPSPGGGDQPLVAVPIPLKERAAATESSADARSDAGAQSASSEDEDDAAAGDALGRSGPLPSGSPTVSPPPGGASKRGRKGSALGEFGLPEGERALATFSCAYLPGKVPQQGRLICTQRFLCFQTLAIYEPMFGSCKVVVEFSQVASVAKATSAWGLVANSLLVKLKPLAPSGEVVELFFTSLFYRDTCYKEIVQLTGANSSLPHVASGPAEIGAEQAAWRTLDPRLGESYTGNRLVLKEGTGVPTAQAKRKTRNSGFLRLGLSHRDFDKFTKEAEERDRDGASAATQAETPNPKAPAQDDRDGGDAGGGKPPPQEESQETDQAAQRPAALATAPLPFSLPCPTCSSPPSETSPCKCWTVQGGADVALLPDHTLLSVSFWRGSLEQNAGLLWLGVDLPAGIAKPRVADLAELLGRELGDFDQDFSDFKETGGPEAWNKFARPGYPVVRPVLEGSQSENDQVLSRVVSFSHPIGNTPFGKQVAKSTQLQRIWRCRVQGDEGLLRVAPGATSIELCCDTSLAGFPYSDSFMVRSRYVLTRLENPDRSHSDEAWCRLDSTCRIAWLKSVSVPFLKGKIEKENVQTGKKNAQAWESIARKRLAAATSPARQRSDSLEAAPAAAGTTTTSTTTTTLMEAARASAKSLRLAQSEGADEKVHGDRGEEFEWSRLASGEFYASAWASSSDAQRLQTLLLFAILFMQVLDRLW